MSAERRSSCESSIRTSPPAAKPPRRRSFAKDTRSGVSALLRRGVGRPARAVEAADEVQVDRPSRNVAQLCARRAVTLALRALGPLCGLRQLRRALGPL